MTQAGCHVQPHVDWEYVRQHDADVAEVDQPSAAYAAESEKRYLKMIHCDTGNQWNKLRSTGVMDLNGLSRLWYVPIASPIRSKYSY